MTEMEKIKLATWRAAAQMPNCARRHFWLVADEIAFVGASSNFFNDEQSLKVWRARPVHEGG